MGGTNPYMEKSEAKLPTNKYKITFLPMNKTVEVDPENLPLIEDGQPGSCLQIALANDIEIDHACGGVCACATCHIVVKEGMSSMNEPIEAEEDELDSAPGLTPNSRLACQCVPDGSSDVVVEIPEWNRNLVQEQG